MGWSIADNMDFFRGENQKMYLKLYKKFNGVGKI